MEIYFFPWCWLSSVAVLFPVPRDLLYFSGMSIIFYYLEFPEFTVLSCRKKIMFVLVMYICSPSFDPYHNFLCFEVLFPSFVRYTYSFVAIFWHTAYWFVSSNVIDICLFIDFICLFCLFLGVFLLSKSFFHIVHFSYLQLFNQYFTNIYTLFTAFRMSIHHTINNTVY